MNELQLFENEEFGKVRAVVIDGEPWFVGKDVAVALGYTNPQKAVRDHIDEEDKTVNDSFTVNGTPIILINESGVYSLIMASKLPKAKKFKRWVTSEVIPAIRKTGGYIYNDDVFIDHYLPGASPQTRAFVKSQLNIVHELDRQMAEMKPKADYCDNVLFSEGLLSTTEIAKEYGLSARKLNQMLADWKVQYKVNGVWVLYNQYADKGYTQPRTYLIQDDNSSRSFQNTYWTQAGRYFLYNLLKEHGILPLSERVTEGVLK